MAIPSTYRFNINTLSCHSASIGTTPIPAMLRVPFRCQVLKLTGVAVTSISAADCSVSIASYTSGTATAITTLTLAVANADAGQVNSVVPGAVTVLQEDDVIKFIPSGATGTNTPGTFTAVLRAF